MMVVPTGPGAYNREEVDDARMVVPVRKGPERTVTMMRYLRGAEYHLLGTR